jgi:PAS domain S-box-containing protein
MTTTNITARDLINSLPFRVVIQDREDRYLLSNAAQWQALGAAIRETVVGNTDQDFDAQEAAHPQHEEDQAVMASGQPLIREEEILDATTGKTAWLRTTKLPWRDESGAIAGLITIRQDITQEKELAAELRRTREELEKRVAERTTEISRERSLLRTIIDISPDAIYVKDRPCHKTLANPAELKYMGCQTESEAVGKSDFEIYPEELARGYFADDQAVIEGGQPVLNREEKVVSPNGEVRWVLSSKIPLRDADGNITGLVGMGRDITERRKAEELLRESEAKLRDFTTRLKSEIEERKAIQLQLEAKKVSLEKEIVERIRMEKEVEKVHHQLVDASRRAGMAQIATGVLHNVGNVLNSANISTDILEQNARNSRLQKLSDLVRLLNEHAGDLAEFLTRDPKGQKVVGYLKSLEEYVQLEQNQRLEELGNLKQHMEHMREIVAMQQDYTKTTSTVCQMASLADVVEDSLLMHSAAFARHEVRLVKEFADIPPFLLDRHKVLQILINVLNNAKQACDENTSGDKWVAVRVQAVNANQATVEIEDNGRGIAPENLQKIFNHGFTTRVDGHGFGLHSSANAATEMHGSLTARSEGIGKGATFILTIPRTT